MPAVSSGARLSLAGLSRLARRRTSSGFGSNPITWADISAFEHHAKFPLKPWEVEMIEDLDDIDRAEQARSQSANQNNGTGKT
jgi:hypothetical protein